MSFFGLFLRSCSLYFESFRFRPFCFSIFSANSEIFQRPAASDKVGKTIRRTSPMRSILTSVRHLIKFLKEAEVTHRPVAIHELARIPLHSLSHSHARFNAYFLSLSFVNMIVSLFLFIISRLLTLPFYLPFCLPSLLYPAVPKHTPTWFPSLSSTLSVS